MSAMGGLIDLISRGGSYAATLENEKIRAATEAARQNALAQEAERRKVEQEIRANEIALADQNVLGEAMRRPGMNRAKMAEFLGGKLSPGGFQSWRKQDLALAEQASKLDDAERKRQTDLNARAGQILAVVANSKDPMAAYAQAFPQLQALKSDFEFPAAEQFDKEQLPFLIGALGYADDYLKQQQGAATVAKTEQDTQNAAQKALEEQREAFVSQLRPDMTHAEYQALRAQYPQMGARFPATVGQWIGPAMKTAIAMKDRAKAAQEDRILAGMSETGITATDQAQIDAANERAQLTREQADAQLKAQEKHWRAIEANARSQVATGKSLQAESTLRDDFRQESKTFQTVADAYGRIRSSSGGDSGAADISLIFSYMRMLDPGSTVREGEFATAQNAGSIPERIRAMYNKAISGERLDPNVRNQFIGQAEKLYGQSLSDHERTREQYRGIAQRTGVNPENVLIDYRTSAAKPKGIADLSTDDLLKLMEGRK